MDESTLFVPEDPKSRKGVVIRYAPITVLLQCAVCGTPLDIRAKTKEVRNAMVLPCRVCLKKAREDAAKPYHPKQVFTSVDPAIEDRIRTILESE